MPSPKPFRPATLPLIGNSRVSYASGSRTADAEIWSADSDDTDDEEYANWGTSSKRQLLQRNGAGEDEFSTLWEDLMHSGGLGEWFFQTTAGWYFYLVVLGLVLVGSTACLHYVNRVVTWASYLQSNRTGHTRLLPLASEVHYFPYPTTLRFCELLATHVLLVLAAGLTQFFSRFLCAAGLFAAVAPSHPMRTQAHRAGKSSLKADIQEGLCIGSGAIAGGGLFEFEYHVVKQVLPLACLLVGELILKTYLTTSLGVADYVMARIGSVPAALVLARTLNGHRYSISSNFSATTATVFLGLAAYRTPNGLDLSKLLVGLLSSVLTALSLLQMLRTYQHLLSSLIVPGESLAGSSHQGDASGTPQENRAFYRLLHYASMLRILLYLPVVIASGELPHLSRHSALLEVYVRFSTVIPAMMASTVSLVATFAVVRATSPLTAAVIEIPEATLLLCIGCGFNMAAGPWLSLAVCWLNCLCYVVARAKNSRSFNTHGFFGL